MKHKHEIQNPAQVVIDKCGGHAVVAEITGRALSAVYKWTYPRERQGSNGLIPAEAQAMLMAAAQRGEVDLEPSDFFRNAD